MLLGEARERLRHAGGERAREGADVQLARDVARELLELARGELEPVGDHVGVRQQQLAGGRELQAARPAVEQPRARLALERGDLLGDRGLGERQRLGRA